jgi:thiamine transport system substrate-binding protein
MRPHLLLAGLLAAGAASAQDAPVLTIYTYESFNTEWGPGPQIEANFEATCGCDLRFVGVGDGASLVARLRLEGARTEADIVLGLDTNLTAAATETGLFAPHGMTPEGLDLPVAWTDPVFLPFDWSHFAFVYDKAVVPVPPTSFRELAESDLRVVIQDPRSSTPGLGLVLWVKAAYGDEAPAIWEGLADNVLTVTRSWSEAYGLFQEGEADMVTSWTTSPAYHVIAEEDDSKAAAIFEEGHYIQIEVAGKVASTDVPELADAFLEFMLGEGFQGVIPTTQWMYPANIPEGGLPEAYGELGTPATTLLFSPGEAAAVRDSAVAEWQSALSR